MDPVAAVIRTRPAKRQNKNIQGHSDLWVAAIGLHPVWGILCGGEQKSRVETHSVEICSQSQGAANMNPITAFLVFVLVLAGLATGQWVNLYLSLPFFVAAAIVAASLKMANVWQKFVILRMGKLQSVKGPGMFLIIPILDNVIAVIDERIQTTAFNAEQALTRDTVPVNVDAIIFWHVHDAEKAALAITNYREAIDRVAQTSLREMIGSSMLAALLSCLLYTSDAAD